MVKLSVQKRLAASILKCSPKRVNFDDSRLGEIKESITKADIRGLINDKAIIKIQKQGISRGRADKNIKQKQKGKRRGPGSRKGTRNARSSDKRKWINTIRLQRSILVALKENGLIDKKTYRMLYSKAKGGFFRSKRHLKIYIEERGLLKTKKE